MLASHEARGLRLRRLYARPPCRYTRVSILAGTFTKWEREGFSSHEDRRKAGSADGKPKKGNMGGGDPEQVKRYLDERREYKRQKRHEREKNLQQELAHVKPDVNHRLPFARLGVPPRAAEELEGMGFLEPTEVQERGIPAILSGQHCALLAETGSGKTLAYSLPSFAEVAAASAHKGKVPNHCCPSVIVVVPTLETQELAKQTGAYVNMGAEVSSPSRARKGRYFVHVLAGKEKKLLKPIERRAARRKQPSRKRKPKKSKEKLSGPALEHFRKFEAADGVVGTPQKLFTLLKLGFLRPDKVRHLILDEADLLASHSYSPDVEKLLSKLGGKSMRNASGCPIQIVFSCATMDSGQYAQMKLWAPGNLAKVTTSGHHHVPRNLHSSLHRVSGSFESRIAALMSSLESSTASQALIFAKDTETADGVTEELSERGIPVGCFHGRRVDRGEQLDAFLSMELAVLVSTDLGARGIDLPSVEHVVEFDPADDLTLHLHRLGRTARAGQDGPFYGTTIVGEEDEGSEGVQRIVDALIERKSDVINWR